jgi:thiol-disulfide isomerase/thioredoxin
VHSGIVVLALCGAAAASAAPDLVSGVRSAVSRRDFASAESQLSAYRAQRGVTPEWLAAFSWLGRGALAAGSLERAGNWAEETHRLATGMLRDRTLDAERHLPIALGAAIEVRAQVLAARGERAEALEFLKQQLALYGETSIRTRIQKNVNLLSLEGKPAPALDMEKWVGSPPAPLAALKGRPVLIFLWAHWCGDCKAMAPEIAKVKEQFKDLAIVAPTQLYGYVARGMEAPPESETAYIADVWKKFFSALDPAGIPLGPENMRRYGASTTPTLVLLDRQGVVRMYNPGGTSSSELAARLQALPH